MTIDRTTSKYFSCFIRIVLDNPFCFDIEITSNSLQLHNGVAAAGIVDRPDHLHGATAFAAGDSGLALLLDGRDEVLILRLVSVDADGFGVAGAAANAGVCAEFLDFLVSR